jgi:hypothetical protein
MPHACSAIHRAANCGPAVACSLPSVSCVQHQPLPAIPQVATARVLLSAAGPAACARPPSAPCAQPPTPPAAQSAPATTPTSCLSCCYLHRASIADYRTVLLPAEPRQVLAPVWPCQCYTAVTIVSVHTCSRAARACCSDLASLAAVSSCAASRTVRLHAGHRNRHALTAAARSHVLNNALRHMF